MHKVLTMAYIFASYQFFIFLCISRVYLVLMFLFFFPPLSPSFTYLMSTRAREPMSECAYVCVSVCSWLVRIKLFGVLKNKQVYYCLLNLSFLLTSLELRSGTLTLFSIINCKMKSLNILRKNITKSTSNCFIQIRKSSSSSPQHSSYFINIDPMSRGHNTANCNHLPMKSLFNISFRTIHQESIKRERGRKVWKIVLHWLHDNASNSGCWKRWE